ncbi:hypothetical protein [Novosphingobium sp.]|uniref:hypothetical protein n=1 Tax=Novosphingobium sp. TaxID=1874826 RepID=UPI00262C71AB|nr:hypothetical protein [Novosphingobium sp.]
MNAMDAALLAVGLFGGACGFSAGYGWGRILEAQRYTWLLAQVRQLSAAWKEGRLEQGGPIVDLYVGYVVHVADLIERQRA